MAQQQQQQSPKQQFEHPHQLIAAKKMIVRANQYSQMAEEAGQMFKVRQLLGNVKLHVKCDIKLVEATIELARRESEAISSRLTFDDVIQNRIPWDAPIQLVCESWAPFLNAGTHYLNIKGKGNKITFAREYHLKFAEGKMILTAKEKDQTYTEVFVTSNEYDHNKWEVLNEEKSMCARIALKGQDPWITMKHIYEYWESLFKGDECVIYISRPTGRFPVSPATTVLNYTDAGVSIIITGNDNVGNAFSVRFQAFTEYATSCFELSNTYGWKARIGTKTQDPWR
jgi:hypothetical protein